MDVHGSEGERKMRTCAVQGGLLEVMRWQCRFLLRILVAHLCLGADQVSATTTSRARLVVRGCGCGQ